MKELTRYIYELHESLMFESIDSDIICESVESSILRRLINQLKGTKEKYENRNASFSRLFGSYNVKWTDVTDDMFKKYDAGDKKGISMARKIISWSTRGIDAIALFIDPNSPETFIYVLTPGCLYNLKSKRYVYDTDSYETEVRHNSTRDMKQYEISDYAEKYDFYILEYSKVEISSTPLRNERWSNRNGILIPGDTYQNQQIARDNISRYKKILAEKRAKAAAQDDEITDLVNETIQKVLEVCTDAFKNPEQYINCYYTVGCLNKLVYSTRNYDSKRGATGYEGLLPLYSSYLDDHIAKANGHSSYSTSSKDKIMQMIEKINKTIEEIESKIVK